MAGKIKNHHGTNRHFAAFNPKTGLKFDIGCMLGTFGRKYVIFYQKSTKHVCKFVRPSASFFSFLTFKLPALVFLFLFGLFLYSDIARNPVENICLSILGCLVTTIILDFKNTTTFARVFFMTFPRDMWALFNLVRFNRLKLPWLDRHKKSPARLLEDTAKLNPYKPAIIQAETGQEMNFHEMNEYVSSVANFFIDKTNLKTGDAVALISDNRIEYGPIWLGLNRAGLIPALINFKLTGDGLKHCINIVNSKAVIVLTEFLDEVLDCGLSSEVQIFETLGTEALPSARKYPDRKVENITNLTQALKNSNRLMPIKAHIPASLKDTVAYIYTSGTTGLPKAAKISMVRYSLMTFMPNFLYRMPSDARFYNTLPMYHSNAGLVAFGTTINFGFTQVLRKKFSASAFWEDVVKYNCTTFNYIGEICRFLLAKPISNIETRHNIKFVIGNGLKPEIWRKFCDRFQIPRVCEFYGATEGVANIGNTNNVEGAVGFITRIAPIFYPVAVAKVDPETEEFIRDPVTGLVQMCKPDEVGMIIGRVDSKGMLQFQGYHEKKQNDSKYLFDVMIKGDVYFKTGDLVTADEYGNVRFMDRTGDTFRWKGENCSTAEVDATVGKIINNNDITLACVSCIIPGNEGNAGLLVIDNSSVEESQRDEFNQNTIKILSNQLKVELPAYQIPIFIRITNKIEVTGTFKIQKAKIKKLGYDLSKLPATDQIYVYQKQGYVRMDDDLFQKIQNSEVRF